MNGNEQLVADLYARHGEIYDAWAKSADGPEDSSIKNLAEVATWNGKYYGFMEAIEMVAEKLGVDRCKVFAEFMNARIAP